MSPDAFLAVFEAGRQQGMQDRPMDTRRDDLDNHVIPGDYVIRHVSNGYIIRKLTVPGGMAQTWLVEGDLADVAKQLTAIQATEKMQQADAAKIFTVGASSASGTAALVNQANYRAYPNTLVGKMLGG